MVICFIALQKSKATFNNQSADSFFVPWLLKPVCRLVQEQSPAACQLAEDRGLVAATGLKADKINQILIKINHILQSKPLIDFRVPNIYIRKIFPRQWLSRWEDRLLVHPTLPSSSVQNLTIESILFCPYGIE